MEQTQHLSVMEIWNLLNGKQSPIGGAETMTMSTRNCPPVVAEGFPVTDSMMVLSSCSMSRWETSHPCFSVAFPEELPPQKAQQQIQIY